MRQQSWRVWLVTDVYPPDCGGSGWSTHALARVLLNRGHKPHVIVVEPTRNGVTHRNFEQIEIAEVGVRAAHRNPWRRLGSHDYTYGVLSDYLSQRLTENPDVDILHAQHLHSAPPTIHVGRVHGLATVVTVRDYWPVCLHGTSWWGSADCKGCSASNLTHCMTEYWNWPRPLARLMVGWSRRRLGTRRGAVAAAHRIIAVSSAVRRRIEGELPGARLSVLPNMVDPDVLATAASGGVPTSHQAPYLLTAGKLVPTKGFDLLISALAEIGHAPPLVVAGDGPSRRDLEEQSRALGVATTFCGWVGHDQLLRMQRDAHAVVVPSAWQEPLSRFVLETLGLGTPVIAWARGGTPEIIESGLNGWLVDQTADLAAALSQLESPARRRQVGLAGRARVLNTYAPDVVYPGLAEVYAGAMSEAGRSQDAG